MANLPEQFDYAGIHCYRSPDDPNTLLYIPGAPMPQHSADETPMISLTTFAPFAFLQVSVQWDVLDEELDGLRAALAQRDPELNIDVVRLALAPVSIERVALELTEADGSIAELQSTHSSGMPPFSALFNVQLNEAQQAAVASALNGRTGVLGVRYHAALTVPQPAEVRIAGDIAPDLANASSLAGQDDAAALLDAAIERGHLTITRSGAPDVPAERWQALEQQARNQAIDLLLRLAVGSTHADAAHFEVVAADTKPTSQPLERVGDVADWFAAHSGLDHMQIVR
jgi:hypothetical protein